MDRFINTEKEDYDLIKPYYNDNDFYFTDKIKRFKKLCYIYYYNKKDKIMKRPRKLGGMYIYSFALNPDEYIPKGIKN